MMMSFKRVMVGCVVIVVLAVIVITILNSGTGLKNARYRKANTLAAGELGMKTENIIKPADNDQEFIIVTLEVPSYYLVPSRDQWKNAIKNIQDIIDRGKEKTKQMQQQGLPVVDSVDNISVYRECSKSIDPKDFRIMFKNGSTRQGVFVGQTDLEHPELTPFEDSISCGQNCKFYNRIKFYVARRLLDVETLSVAFASRHSFPEIPKTISFQSGPYVELKSEGKKQ